MRGFIAKAIQSVLDQRVNSDYEIVVGEDWSTYGTRAIVMDFKHPYPDRIVSLFRARNLGGGHNIVDMLAVCQSEYLALLGGDDFWTSPDKLQHQVDFLDQHREYSIRCCQRKYSTG
jgi:glycosyltransferase involved in cell wall biosynthesis